MSPGEAKEHTNDNNTLRQAGSVPRRQEIVKQTCRKGWQGGGGGIQKAREIGEEKIIQECSGRKGKSRSPFNGIVLTQSFLALPRVTRLEKVKRSSKGKREGKNWRQREQNQSGPERPSRCGWTEEPHAICLLVL